MSKEKFVIEKAEDIQSGFEKLDGELADLKEKSEELVKKIDAMPNVDDQVGELAKDIKSLREDYAKASSKLRTKDGTPATELPCDPEEFKEFGMKAVYGGKTEFTINHRNGDIEPNGPISRWQKHGDDVQLTAALLSAAKGRQHVDPRSVKLFGSRYAPAYGRVTDILKSAVTETTTDPGAGDWVPDTMSPQLDVLLSLNQRLLSFIPSYNLPRSPFLFPRQKGRTTHGYRASTGTVAATGTRTVFAADAIGTTEMSDNVTFTGRRIWGLSTIADDADQDSIVALLPFYRNDMVESLARNKEDAFLNGDMTATHQDADVHAIGAADHRKAWYGLRYFGLNGPSPLSAGGNAIDSNSNWATYIQAQIATMGAYGDVQVFNGNPDDLVIAVSGKEWWGSILSIPEFRHMNTYGAGSTIKGINANVGFKPDGCWLVVSEMARHDVNASGVEDGITTNLTTIPIFNRKAWAEGVFQGMRVRTFDDAFFAVYGQMGIMLDWRGDVQAIKGPQAEVASQKHTVCTYNVA